MRPPTQSAVLLICLARVAECGQLPLSVFTTVEGLASNSVHRIVADSRGFLWFATGEGLSSFDGYQFTTYSTDQGLPHRAVYDLIKTRNGIYWIATPAGLTRFEPYTRLALRTYVLPPPAVSSWINAVLEDDDGTLWCGAKEGLYRFAADSGTFARIDFVQPRESGEDRSVRALLKDRAGAVWAASGSGLYRRRGQGWERFTTHEGLPTNDCGALFQDSQGRLWAGTAKGLCQIAVDAIPGRRSVTLTLEMKDGLPGESIQCLHEQTGGHLWIGTNAGLAELSPQSTSPRAYSARPGLGDFNIESLAEDGRGNLWIGTGGGGVMRRPREWFLSFTSADGLAPGSVVSIYESHGGELCVVTRDGTRLFANHLAGERFVAMRLNLPAEVTNSGWGWGQIVAEDARGRSWVATGQGPAVFPRAAGSARHGYPSTAELIPFRGPHASNVFRLFSDARHTIWISASASGGNSLASFAQGAKAFRHYSAEDGLPATGQALWSAFTEDRSGNVWIGSLRTSEVMRYRNGKFTVFTNADGLPPGEIRWLYTDRSGRLWMASGGSGLIRVDDPGSEHPRFLSCSTRQGLSTNFTTSIAEDRLGRVYVSTGKGVDRLDPVSGRIRHYTAADGLVRGELQVGFSDRQGRIWFGGPLGVSQLVPEPDRPRPPPPVLITAVRIAGAPYHIAAVGQAEVSGVELRPGQSQLHIEFAGLGFGDDLRYQFKLEGAETDWSTPTGQRSVEYAQLSPGRYRFLVRALADDGLQSPQPAALSFVVIVPMWRRWWFLTLAAFAGGLLISAVYRYRIAHLLDLERMRTRIATDLHDDIGSSLSQIAILSEVVRRRITEQDPTIHQHLSHIAQISRELVDALGEIVWAMQTSHDRLDDLTTRMRHFASNIFTAREIDFEFHVLAPDANLKLDAAARRQVFLIFKEAVNNIVRHANCSRVGIDFKAARDLLLVTVSDNGIGITPGSSGEGHGLANMRRRAEALGGNVTVASNGQGLPSSGQRGVVVTLTVPLAGSRKPLWRRFLHT